MGSPVPNLIAAQVNNPLLPALHCLHEGCLEGEPDIDMLIQCTPLLVEKAGVVPDVTIRFTLHNQVVIEEREPPWL